MQTKVFDEINVDSISRLMDVFYDKVRADKNGLGDIFNTKIGTSNEEWVAHKAKIGNFWQGMLLGIGNYNGQPMKTHLDLPPFPRELFNVWLGLFEESLNIVFSKKEHVYTILERAKIIAGRFQYMLYESKH